MFAALLSSSKFLNLHGHEILNARINIEALQVVIF